MIRDMNRISSSYAFCADSTTKTPEVSDRYGRSSADLWRSDPGWEILSETASDPVLPSESTVAPASSKRKVRKSGKSSYKHVPHRDKPPHLVARRNARERRRVQAVNSAFSRLRKCVPNENRNKRLSKVKTLHRAIEYIQTLQEVLERADAELSNPSGQDSSELLMDDGFDDRYMDGRNQQSSINKENEAAQRWIADSNWDNDTHNSCLSFYDDFPDQAGS